MIIYIFCTVGTFVTIWFVKSAKMNGVALTGIQFVYGKTLSMFEAYWVSVLLSLTFFLAYSLYRSIR